MKTAYEILKEANLMSKEVLAAEVNGSTVELSEKIDDASKVTPLTFSDKEGKKVFWHTASHILAQAVKRLYPEAKLTIGPSVENGTGISIKVALATLVGLALAIGIVFLLYVTDDRIKTQEDILRSYNVPVLGVIPPESVQ